MQTLPGHTGREIHHRIDCIQERAIPVIFENAPTAFNWIVLGGFCISPPKSALYEIGWRRARMRAAEDALSLQAIGSESASERPLPDGAPRCLNIRLRTAFLHHLRRSELPRRWLMGGNDAHGVSGLANIGAILTLLHRFGGTCKNPLGYARVSTLDQKPALQIDALKAAGIERIFTEKAGGAQRERPELSAALDYIRQGDTLVVWKLDRLARSMRQLIETVEDLQSRGIELRSLTESIDTATPGGCLVFHIFGALAEFERAVIRERTSAGLQAARERGKKGGRPRTLGPKDLAAAKALL